MSAYYAKHGEPEVRVYKLHGRTKQSQKDECDINKLLERYAREGTMSHLEKYQAVYGDYGNYDFEGHTTKLAEMSSIFEELPAEVKKEFNQSPKQFFTYVTNPENAEKLPQLLPKIANQGDYFAAVSQRKGTEPEAPQEQKAQKQGTQDVAPEKPPTEE